MDLVRGDGGEVAEEEVLDLHDGLEAAHVPHHVLALHHLR
jgi:hypothetical protein